MKKQWLMTLAAISAAITLYAENPSDTFICIETEKSSMILEAREGEVIFHHYGSKVGNPAQFKGLNSYRRADYGTDPQAYPATGGRYFNEAALTIEYPGSQWNTELEYISHHSYGVSDGVTRTCVFL